MVQEIDRRYSGNYSMALHFFGYSSLDWWIGLVVASRSVGSLEWFASIDSALNHHLAVMPLCMAGQVTSKVAHSAPATLPHHQYIGGFFMPEWFHAWP